MAYGKQIRLFLTDGSPSGVRYAELMNWTGQAFAFPKVHFSSLSDWPETQRAGVYILLGVTNEGDDAAYIGESENVAKRLLQHVAGKTLDDIILAFFFTSKDDNLTKGHITFLERRLLKRAQEAKQCKVQCDREPSEKVLSKSETATMEEFLENLYLVSAALGFDVFELPPVSSSLPVDSKEKRLQKIGDHLSFGLENGITARGFQSDEGFVVFKGSEATLADTTSLQSSTKALKDTLKKNGVLIEDEGKLKFTQDYSFRSSSAAAGVVAGSQRSGPASWKNPDGKSLGAIESESATQVEATLPSTSSLPSELESPNN